MNKFPILISIPHGGRRIPPEVTERIRITQKDIFHDIDPFTIEIYNIGNIADEIIINNIARPFVDMSRAPDDLPPTNPDGVIKTSTCHGVKIYKSNQDPDKKLIEQLLESYWKPYHEEIRNCLENSNIDLGLDCHSMAPIGPTLSPDKGKKRPLFCLGNGFGQSCDEDTITRLSECLRESFRIDADDITINHPFSGGYITRKYGNNPVPWIQVEMNRSLYLDSLWFDDKNLTIDYNRLEELRRCFVNALGAFFS